MGRGHRCGGQDSDELQPHGGTVPFHPLHKAVRRTPACPFLPRHEGREGRENHLEQNLGGTGCRQCAVLPQLVDIGTAIAHGGCGWTVHLHHRHRLRLPADGRTVDEPSAEAQSDGGCVQHGEREFHAGDKAAGERLFREPAHTLLLPQAVEQRLDQRGQSLPCLHRTGYAGQR